MVHQMSENGMASKNRYSMSNRQENMYVYIMHNGSKADKRGDSSTIAVGDKMAQQQAFNGKARKLLSKHVCRERRVK